MIKATLWPSVFLFCFGISAAAYSESTDRNQPIHIKAAHAHFDQTKRVGIYSGHVVVTQGSMVLQAEKVTISEEADSTHASYGNGSPVTFRARLDDGQWIHAKCLHYTYNGKTGILTLIDKAWVRNGHGDEVTADIITYNLRTKVYHAKRKPNSPHRVTVILQARVGHAPDTEKSGQTR